jgi:AbrB family looped-hinge helix DNA binding protein
MTAHTLTSKGQVTIPKAIRERLGLKPGAKVEFEVTRFGDVLLKRHARSRKLADIRRDLESLRGTATGGMTTEEIMLLTRGRRI